MHKWLDGMEVEKKVLLRLLFMIKEMCQSDRENCMLWELVTIIWEPAFNENTFSTQQFPWQEWTIYVDQYINSDEIYRLP